MSLELDSDEFRLSLIIVCEKLVKDGRGLNFWTFKLIFRACDAIFLDFFKKDLFEKAKTLIFAVLKNAFIAI